MAAVRSAEELRDTEEKIGRIFLKCYESYIERFERLGIALDMKPCYYYAGKYHSDHRASGCFSVFRVQLYPAGLTFSQAKRERKYKLFFSHKLFVKKKGGELCDVQSFPVYDGSLKKFLDKYLKKAQKCAKNGGKPADSLRENITDVFRTNFHFNRYRNERIKKYRGVEVDAVKLAFVILLAIVSIPVSVRIYSSHESYLRGCLPMIHKVDLFAVNPNWAKYHSMFDSDRTMRDEANNFTLQLDMFSETGTLTDDSCGNKYTVYFELPAKDESDEFYRISIEPRLYENSRDESRENRGTAVNGKCEYDDKKNTIRITIETSSTDDAAGVKLPTVLDFKYQAGR